jgi:regulatory protein
MELRSRLRQKGFDPDVIASVLDRLQESGLQDDARFATQFAEMAVGRGMAGRRVQAELRGRGIEKEIASDAAVQHPDEELARARELAGRRAARMSDLAPEVRLRRLMGLLARRGYDPQTARTVASEASGIDALGSPSLDRAVERDLP